MASEWGCQMPKYLNFKIPESLAEQKFMPHINYINLFFSSKHTYGELGSLMYGGFDTHRSQGLDSLMRSHSDSPAESQSKVGSWSLIFWHLVNLGFLCSSTSKACMLLNCIHIFTHLLIDNYWTTTMCKTEVGKTRDRSEYWSGIA